MGLPGFSNARFSESDSAERFCSASGASASISSSEYGGSAGLSDSTSILSLLLLGCLWRTWFPCNRPSTARCTGAGCGASPPAKLSPLPIRWT
ncbi:hypothetical protein EYF80_020689 [Liparis tanakae]|uniref:Uncharacterized protein n=1 Tax=Liparis tanakae TaxID=230148 RepID=A0A4Z2HTC2_9TELE|nr:hypothetical protein EYF80_020689 [Liparis tanakae]